MNNGEGSVEVTAEEKRIVGFLICQLIGFFLGLIIIDGFITLLRYTIALPFLNIGFFCIRHRWGRSKLMSVLVWSPLFLIAAILVVQYIYASLGVT